MFGAYSHVKGSPIIKRISMEAPFMVGGVNM